MTDGHTSQKIEETEPEFAPYRCPAAGQRPVKLAVRLEKTMVTPSHAGDIVAAIQELFSDASGRDPKNFLSALVPVNRSFIPGRKSIPFHLDQEMNELCCFANDFGVARLEYLPQEFSTDKQRTEQLRTRLRILLYCHIMEAVFPMLTIYNLIRVLRGRQSCWTFYIRKSDDTVARTKGNDVVCADHPGERIEQIELQCKGLRPNIGSLLKEIWCRDLRNAFPHSQYCLEPDCSMIATGCVTGVGKRTHKDISKHEIYFSAEDIVKRYDAAYAYLRTFTGCYNKYISIFKDQNVYQTESGNIWWDKERMRWRFYK